MRPAKVKIQKTQQLGEKLEKWLSIKQVLVQIPIPNADMLFLQLFIDRARQFIISASLHQMYISSVSKIVASLHRV